MSTQATRTEHDSLGAIEVPADALWGAETQRCLEHFAIGSQTMPLSMVHAMARIKRAAARVNAELGLLDLAKAHAVAEAATQVVAGRHDRHFPLSLWQTGSGTQSHMNLNEVLANLASLALGGGLGAARVVDPHDHVNRGQSSNDVFPTAMHMAAAARLAPLLSALADLRATLRAKAVAFDDVVKVGRTHLQDATPVTMGQEFTAYDAQLALADTALQQARQPLLALPLGGTAVGNGMNTHAEFGARVIRQLALELQTPFTATANRLAGTAGHEALVILHGALRLLAVVLIKFGNDLRLMASGPRAGLGEIELPANEPGSSIMPGKVNPTQVEAMLMVCQQVMGHDVAIGIAASQGQFELNACKPLIAFDLLESLQLLTDAMTSFSRFCLQGITVRAATLAGQIDRSLMLAAALAPHIGHARAAALATRAHEQGQTLREVAVATGEVSAADFDAWVSVREMLGPRSQTHAPP
ncbi:MAG: class II fumarate hydratase [Aquabacterium sp.]|nr:class II fumarate hydratase [Aquabacterium sp.]